VKQYPSILRDNKGLPTGSQVWLFDKLDGSNLRFEWDHKRGWHLFGTRTQLLKPDHPWLGPAIPMFLTHWAAPLENLARTQKWQNITAFCEFWGVNSFAGFHFAEDLKHLTLIDIHVYKKGLIAPERFLELCSSLQIARFLGVRTMSRGLLEEVKTRQLEGMSFEGVIAKAGSGHGRVMQKIKTQAWIDRVKEKFSSEEAAKILSS
jgi:hypothetical protein